MKLIKNYNLDFIENWLLRNLFLILIIIFFIIIFLYLVPIIADIKQLKGNELINLRFLDIKYTITSLGAIFVFWYGYKKYERDKNYLNIEKLIEYEENKLSKLILRWNLYFQLKKNREINNIFFLKLEKISRIGLLKYILEAKEEENIKLAISTSLYIFDKNKYIKEQLMIIKNIFLSTEELDKDLKNQIVKNKKKFIKIVGILESDINKNFYT